MNKDINVISDKIINYLLKGIIVILPLFFLPLTTSRVGVDFFNKEYLLWLAVPIIFFIFAFRLLNQTEAYLLKTKLDKYLLAYLGLLLLSAVLSIDRFASFFGSFGSATQPFISIFTLILFFYIVINYLDTRDRIFQVLRMVLASYIVIVVVAVLLLLGYFGNNPILTKYFTLAVGNLEDLSVYLAVINVFVFSVITNKAVLHSIYSQKKTQWLLRVVFGLSLFILSLINFYLSWLVLFVGVLLPLGINKVKKSLDNKEKVSWRVRTKNNIWAIVVLALAAIFLINHFSYGGMYEEKTRFYQNFQLDIANSARITYESLKHDPFFGSGPETYSSLFSKYRSPGFNQNEYWALRFNQGSSFVSELMATTGLLPSIAYLCVLFYALAFGFSGIMSFKNNQSARDGDSENLAGILTLLFVLVLVEFLFPISVVLRFLLWLFAGIMFSYLRISGGRSVFEHFKISNRKKVKTLLTPLMYLILFAGLTLFAYEIRFWVADTTYAKAIASKNISARENEIVRAIRLNKYRGSFYASLSKHYLVIARTELQKNEQNKNLELINDNINKSIDAAQNGIEIDPDYVVLYETLGMIYRSMSALTGNTGPLAKQAFAKASELEPSNPVLKTELAKSMFASKEYDEAISTLEQAIDLKEDYYDAHFNLARAYIQKGENAKALTILNRIEGEISNPEFFYEKGRANYGEKNYEEAISDFRLVLNNIPLHSNALFSLANALEQTGDADEALSYYKKALIINPDSESLKAKVEELEK